MTVRRHSTVLTAVVVLAAATATRADGPRENPPQQQIRASLRGAGARPLTVVNEDRSTLTTLLTVEARGASFTPRAPLDADVALARATAVEVRRPAPGRCAARPVVSSSNHSKNVLLSFTGTDTLPADDCRRFAEELLRGGFEAVYSEAPWKSGDGTATVSVVLSP